MLRCILPVLLGILSFVNADQLLGASALVPCMDTTTVTASQFSILYNHNTRTVYYNASVNVAFSGYVYADIELWVYGLKAISSKINPCSGDTEFRELCPLTTGAIDIQSNSVLSKSITKHLPGIAFNVPDLDAYLIAKVRNNTNNDLLACLYVPVYNMRSVQQTSVKWVTAVLSGIGLLVSCILIFMGTSVNSMNISAVTVLMLSYFQSMAFLDMQAIERVPPIASAWNENIIWSVGLIYTSFMQKIFRWYVQATGGTPATYHIYATKPVLVQKLRKRASDLVDQITPRVKDWMHSTSKGRFTKEGKRITQQLMKTTTNLMKRENSGASEAYAKSSSNLVVYRGIERTAYDMHIEVTNAVLTSYTFFIFICVCVVFVFACLWFILSLSTKSKRKEEQFEFPVDKKINPEDNASYNYSEENQSVVHSEPSLDIISQESEIKQLYKYRSVYYFHMLPMILKGTLLNLWQVAFPPICLFSFWEWTRQDSAAVIVVSVFMFVIALVLLLFNMLRMYLIARKSEKEAGTPGFLLYSDTHTLHKYGYLYSMFNSKYYFFGMVYAAYNFCKACFVGFAQSSGQTQALALFIIEVAMFITVCVTKPFLSKAVNGIQITTHVVITLNAMFFLFFSNLMTQPLIVNGVMGVIYFVLNAAYSLVLLLYIIIFSFICVFWSKKRHRRHAPVDDRQSFILNPEGAGGRDAADELQALGKASQADHIAEGENPVWFQRQSLHEVQNPFEPPVAPPTPQFRGERFSISSPRTFTMNSDTSTKDVPVLNELDSRHRSRESQTSIGLSHWNTKA